MKGCGCNGNLAACVGQLVSPNVSGQCNLMLETNPLGVPDGSTSLLTFASLSKVMFIASLKSFICSVGERTTGLVWSSSEAVSLGCLSHLGALPWEAGVVGVLGTGTVTLCVALSRTLSGS